jgi:hypothetical protein
MAADLVGALVLILLVMAFYRLFKGVDQHLAVLVIIFGVVMPALIYFVNVVSSAGALLLVQGGGFVSVFDNQQWSALVMLFLRLHDYQITAAEMLGSMALPACSPGLPVRFPAAFSGRLAYPHGLAYVIMSLTGLLLPQYQETVFRLGQPAFLGEIALMLWLLIKGAPPATAATTLAAVA